MAQLTDDDDELLDLVDDKDVVVGTIRRGDTLPQENLQGCYIRASSCFIMNAQGKLWIPRRQLTKKIAPGGLDYSAGGHVGSGESYDHAMLRELAEEVGLHVDASQLIPIGKETPPTTPPHFYFSQIYLYFSDTVPSYSYADFSGFEWLSVTELQARLKSGEKAKESMPIGLEFVSAYMLEHQSDK